MRQSQLRFQYRDHEFVKRMALFQFAIGTRHTEEALSREDMIASRIRVAKVLPYQRSAPFISNLSLAIFSGLLLVFAFPDWNLWSLGWVSTAPLIMAVIRERRFWRSLLLRRLVPLGDSFVS
jgi:hypothetical protein